MGNTPGVPQLDGDMTVFGMNAGGDFLPGGNLLRAVQPRRAGVAFGLRGDLRRFGDDQPGTGALAVVFAHQRSRDIARLNAAQTRQRHINTRLGTVTAPTFSGLNNFASDIVTPE